MTDTARTAMVAALAWLLGALCLTTSAHADVEELARLVSARRFVEARQLVQGSDGRALIETPRGRLLYAEAICSSSPNQLSPNDVEKARGHVEKAREALWDSLVPFTPQLVRVWWKCRTLDLQTAQRTRLRARSTLSGKLRHDCEGSASPSIVARNESDAEHALHWEPIADPSPHAQPSAELLERVQGDHEGSATVRVCAPFIAVGADPQGVCDAASRFLSHFSQTYGAEPPDAWIVVHQYARAAELVRHAKRHGGPPCGDFLGYYDYRTQTIAYRAAAGHFGTMQHELTHALLFWDLPMAPEWFDEGLSALYEHTDAGYQALPNPWRVRVLARVDDPQRRFVETTLTLSTFDFLRRGEQHALARRAMMRLQASGQLPTLYAKLKRVAVAGIVSSDPERDLWQGPSDEVVALYRALVEDPGAVALPDTNAPPVVGAVREPASPTSGSPATDASTTPEPSASSVAPSAGAKPGAAPSRSQPSAKRTESGAGCAHCAVGPRTRVGWSLALVALLPLVLCARRRRRSR